VSGVRLLSKLISAVLALTPLGSDQDSGRDDEQIPGMAEPNPAAQLPSSTGRAQG